MPPYRSKQHVSEPRRYGSNGQLVFIRPLRRLPFQYTGRSFTVIQDASAIRYERATPGRLHALLTYTPPRLRSRAGQLLPKDEQDPIEKDESQSFYCAQLIHYGLKPYKTKVAAKKALLKAWDDQGRTLVVPDEIQTTEREMRVEFWANNDQVRKAAVERAGGEDTLERDEQWKRERQKVTVNHRPKKSGGRARPIYKTGPRKEKVWKPTGANVSQLSRLERGRREVGAGWGARC